ncbi:1,4-benzoquinone reductase [Suillus occidentalis]|nr:1,4-benzoquinone reductase [Suillus occidentalis]
MKRGRVDGLSSPNVAIIIHSMYGHIAKKWSAGGEAAIYQYEALAKMHAPAKPSHPIITPNEPAYFFLEQNWWIISTDTTLAGGRQEAAIINSLSTLTHHGIIYVSMGCKNTFGRLANMSEVRGGGAGTFAGPDGSRQSSAIELEIATLQGKGFLNTVSKIFAC